MNLVEMLLGGENKPALSEMSKQFDLSEDQTRSAVKELIPALTRGMQKNTNDAPGLDELLDALKSGKHGKYLDQPNSLGQAQTRTDGNDILGHILGNKQVSRNIASRASERSGISSTILKKMLPIVATVVMGQLSKKVLGGSNKASLNRKDSGGLLTSLLDSDRDGAIWDDLLGMGARAMLR